MKNYGLNRIKSFVGHARILHLINKLLRLSYKADLPGDLSFQCFILSVLRYFMIEIKSSILKFHFIIIYFL